MIERQDRRHQDASDVQASYAATAAAIKDAAAEPPPTWSVTDLLFGPWMPGLPGCTHTCTFSECTNAAMRATCSALACASCFALICGPCDCHDFAEWPEIYNFNT